jgi:glycine/D-amino acid oxidase-like deaminating enzyme
MLNEVPYWWDTAPALPNLMTRPWSERADVVIIGSGYTGLSAARGLAQRGANVVVLEKETFGWGASSRNGGQVLTGLKLGPGKLIQTVGLERARELYAASLASIEHLEELIAGEHIDCGYVQSGHIEAAWKPKHFDHFKHEQEILAREFNHPVRLLDRSEQRHELGSDYYQGVLIDERSGSLHPAQYVRGLATAVFNAGVALFERMPALKIERRGANFRVLTAGGVIEAQDVLVATNGYTDEAAPEIRRRVFPLGSYIIATEPLTSDLAAKLIPRRRVVFDSKNYLYYFRLSADNRLLFGGRADYKPATPESTRESAAILQRGLIEVFPELREVRIEYAWSGNVCFTLDRFPRAGQHNGVYYALGYGGHGVALATYLGAQMANVICDGSGHNPFHDLPFNAIPLYNGTPWFVPFGALWYKFLDLIR